MKKQVLFWLFCLWTGVVALMAQEIPAEVLTAFQKGSPKGLTRYMGDKVELVILNKTTHADKEMASDILTDFFAKNKVSRFDVRHQGKRNESGFLVGTMQTGRGTYRVNCFLRKVNSNYIIHQIRIDKTNE